MAIDRKSDEWGDYKRDQLRDENIAKSQELVYCCPILNCPECENFIGPGWVCSDGVHFSFKYEAIDRQYQLLKYGAMIGNKECLEKNKPSEDFYFSGKFSTVLKEIFKKKEREQRQEVQLLLDLKEYEKMELALASLIATTEFILELEK